MNNRQMPSFKELFVESWEVFKSSFGNIFILSLIGSIIGVGALSATFFGVVGLGFFSALREAKIESLANIQQLQEFLTPERLGMIGVAIFLTIIISGIISSIVKLAVLYVAYNSKDKPTVGQALRVGFVNFIPVFLIGLVVFFLTFGSWFLLIIPGIFVSLYLQYFAYEMVLGEKKWFGGIKGSVQIMSQHLGDVLLRMILFAVGVGVFYQLPIYLLELLAGTSSKDAAAESFGLVLILTTIKIIVGTCVGFYGIVYSVVTYQHAKKATNEELTPSIGWMVVVSLLGWLIATLLGSMAYKTFNNPVVKENIKMVSKEIADDKVVNAMTEDDRVSNWKARMNSEARIIFDESQNTFSNMRAAGSDTKKVKILNDANIVALRKATEIDPTNPEIWAALSDAYTWISTKGSMQDALVASKKAEELDSISWGYANRTGNILLMLGKNDEAILKFRQVVRSEDNFGRAHISLGIAYKRSGIKDLAKIEIQKGIDILEKYNENGDYDVEILKARKEMSGL